MRVALGLALVVQLWTGLCFNCNPRVSIGRRRVFKYGAVSRNGDNEAIEKMQVLSNRGSNAVQPPRKNDKAGGGWDSLKSAIYGTVDGVGSMTQKLRQGDQGLGVQGGYSIIEKNVLGPGGRVSPGQRLMSEYKSRKITPVQTKIAGNAFDSFKSLVYGTADAAAKAFSSDGVDDDETLESFKPLVQSTLSSPEVQKALPDLQSNNLIKRKMAESKIRNWEEQERKRQRALEREEAARKFKEVIYQAGDAVVLVVETLAKTPETLSSAATETGEIAKKVKETVETVPVTVDTVVKSADNLAKSVAAIPDKVQETSTKVKLSVEGGVEKTKQFIDDVQKIPSRVEQSIKETKEKVDGVVAFADETATRVKVLAGLEKPKPKPPKVPPPPPPTATEIGWKVAGTVASGTAKLAWWAGKGVAVTAWNGVSSVVSSQAKNNPELQKILPKQFTSSPADKYTKDSKFGDLSADMVDKEVEDALKLAQSALNYADKETKSRRVADLDKDKS